jgi:hypothetical protein
MEYIGSDLRFIPFEPAVPVDFTVLMPTQRAPSKLVEIFVAYVRNFALAELDPRLVIK